MIYKCNKCDKEFKQKSNYYNHINRKKSCNNNYNINITEHNIDNIDNDNNLCIYCKKIFYNKYSLKRHQLVSKCYQLNNKINILENRINSLSNLSVHNKIINSPNSAIINNQTINIIKFGHENVNDILTKNEIEEILSHGYCALQHSIKTTHFNDKYPEMQNIYVADKKFKYANIYDGTEFILNKCENVLFDLIDNHRNNIEEYLESEDIDVKPKLIIAIKNLLKLLDSNEKQYKEKKEDIIDEIKLMLYNNRKKVIDTHNIKI